MTSVLALCLSLGVFVVLGPVAAITISILGIILCSWGLVQSFRKISNSPPKFLYIIVLVVLLGVLGLGVAINSYVMTPLSPAKLLVPKFSHVYLDPSGLFRLKGPSQWHYTMDSSPRGNGVIVVPVGILSYVGILEIRVMVQELDVKPSDPPAFLRKMVRQLSQSNRNSGHSKALSIQFKEEDLLGGGLGIWSTLDLEGIGVIKWVSFRQQALLGIKNERFLVSVTATGLRHHMDLASVLCQGLFETIIINQNN